MARKRQDERQRLIEEKQRIEEVRLEAERLEAERLEAERLETERLEAERLQAELRAVREREEAEERQRIEAQQRAAAAELERERQLRADALARERAIELERQRQIELERQRQADEQRRRDEQKRIEEEKQRKAEAERKQAEEDARVKAEKAQQKLRAFEDAFKLLSSADRWVFEGKRLTTGGSQKAAKFAVRGSQSEPELVWDSSSKPEQARVSLFKRTTTVTAGPTSGQFSKNDIAKFTAVRDQCVSIDDGDRSIDLVCDSRSHRDALMTIVQYFK